MDLTKGKWQTQHNECVIQKKRFIPDVITSILINNCNTLCLFYSGGSSEEDITISLNDELDAFNSEISVKCETC